MKKQSRTEIFEIKAEENLFLEVYLIFLNLQGIATTHSVHWGYHPPPVKNTIPFSCQAPLIKSEDCPTPLPFRQFPPLYWFFMKPLLKHGFFCEPQK